jgi:hypothetical protein
LGDALGDAAEDALISRTYITPDLISSAN